MLSSQLQQLKIQGSEGVNNNSSVTEGQQAIQVCAALREELAQTRESREQDRLVLRQLQEERATVRVELAAAREELSCESTQVNVLRQDRAQLQVKVQTVEEELAKAQANQSQQASTDMGCGPWV